MTFVPSKAWRDAERGRWVGATVTVEGSPGRWTVLRDYGSWCVVLHESRPADSGREANVDKNHMSLVLAETAEAGTIRPGTLVGLAFALVPITLLLTFSARLAGMLAGTVGAV